MNNNATLSRTISSNSSSSCCGGGDISDHDRVASNTTSQQILSTILKRSRSSVISGTVVADATSITLAEWNSFLMNVLNPHKLWRHVASPTTTSTPVLASDRDTTTLTGAGAPTTTHTSNQVIDSTGRNNTNTTGENTQHDDQGQHDPEIDTVAAEEEAHAEHPDCFKCRKELVAFLQQHNCPPDAAYPSSTTQEVPLQLAVNRYNPIPDCVAWLAQAAPEMVHQRDPASGLLPIETLGRYIVIKEEMNRYSHNSNLLRAVTEKRSTTDDNWECVRVLAVYYSHRYRHYRRRQTTQTTCMPLPPTLHTCLAAQMEMAENFPLSLLELALRRFKHQATLPDADGYIPLDVVLSYRIPHLMEIEEVLDLAEQVYRLVPQGQHIRRITIHEFCRPLDYAICNFGIIPEAQQFLMDIVRVYPGGLNVRSRYPRYHSLIFSTMLERAGVNATFLLLQTTSNFL